MAPDRPRCDDCQLDHRAVEFMWVGNATKARRLSVSDRSDNAGHPKSIDGVRVGGKVDRLFRFRCGSTSGRNGREGARVTCLRCGEIVAIGRFPKDVYPKADQHVCEVTHV